MDAFTIGTVYLALAILLRLVELLVEIITGFVVIIALFVIGWGVRERRKKE